MNKKYDWEVVEHYFMNAGYESRTSLKEIGERFNIPYQTVRRYAAAHEWHRKLFRAKIKRETGMSFEDHLKDVWRQIMNNIRD